MQGRDGVLLDDDGGHAEILDLREGPLDLLHDDRGEALVGLVEEQQLHVARERAADREHLLLAAGKRRALLLPALSEPGEEVVDAFDRPAVWRGDLRQLDILLHGESRDDPPILRHQSDPGARCLVRLHLVQRFVIKPQLALPELGVVQPGDGAQRRGLAGAVASEQRDDLAFAHIEADSLDDVALAVVGVDVPAGEEGGLAAGGQRGLLAGRLALEAVVIKQRMGPRLAIRGGGLRGSRLGHSWAPPRYAS